MSRVPWKRAGEEEVSRYDCEEDIRKEREMGGNTNLG
jgi:hypothetical protein